MLDSHTLVTELLLLISALIGPVHPLQQVIPLKKKIDALTHFARTGDARQYNKVLAEIRKKKAWAETFWAGRKRMRKQLEEGMRRDMDFLNRAGAEAPQIQYRIDADRRTLETIALQESVFPKLIDRRRKEEKAFVQVFRFLENTRKGLKLPNKDAESRR
jgi:hypothetical protein